MKYIITVWGRATLLIAFGLIERMLSNDAMSYIPNYRVSLG